MVQASKIEAVQVTRVGGAGIGVVKGRNRSCLMGGRAAQRRKWRSARMSPQAIDKPRHTEFKDEPTIDGSRRYEADTPVPTASTHCKRGGYPGQEKTRRALAPLPGYVQ
ncbi:hypothetical protein AX16_009018 [Volvariella volvacea WC 439]|nr:hypothetical protein AX16_009018 [Volvariella volvacea WC 439]